MKRLKKIVAHLRSKCVLTPEQADHLASVKFPCC